MLIQKVVLLQSWSYWVDGLCCVSMNKLLFPTPFPEWYLGYAVRDKIISSDQSPWHLFRKGKCRKSRSIDLAPRINERKLFALNSTASTLERGWPPPRCELAGSA